MYMHIIIYTKAGCPWCKGVLDLLNEKNISYEEREVRHNPAFYKEMIEKSGQEKAPTLDIDGVIFADSDRDQVAAYLEAKAVTLV